MAGMIMNQGAE